MFACASFVAAALLLAALEPRAARAQVGEPHRLRFSLGLTLAIDVPAASGLVLIEMLTEPPGVCVLCDPPAADRALSEVLGSPAHRGTASTLSHWALWASWVGGAALSLRGGAAEHRFGRNGWTRGAEDVTFVAEAALTTALLINLTKLGTARRRPDDYYGLQSGGRRRHEAFFSGHAAQGAALAAASTTVAFLRDYQFKVAALIGGSAVALAVGVLRVVALRHWASDVLVGWLVGTAIGIGLPMLLHPRLDDAEQNPSPAVMQTGVPLWIGRW